MRRRPLHWRRQQCRVFKDNSILILLHVVEHFPYDGSLFSAMPQTFKPNDIMAQQVWGRMSELLDTLNIWHLGLQISFVVKKLAAAKSRPDKLMLIQVSNLSDSTRLKIFKT
jgi:hypothetical protein